MTFDEMRLIDINKQLADVSNQLRIIYINAVNNPRLLNIPTYDLNLSCGHPSILYVPNGFSGYKYWMAYTPFPAESRENPCVVVSNDGENWINLPWFINPLATQADADADGLSYNSDPDIILMHNGNIAVYWRGFNSSPKREVIYIRQFSSSTNSWTPGSIIIDTSSTCLSPSIVLESNGTYSMYTVDNTISNNAQKIQRRTSTDGLIWSNPVSCLLSTGITVSPWHIEIRKISDGYILLVDNALDNRTLNYYKSTDGINFIGSSVPIAKSSNSGWDNRGYYRSTFLVLEETPPKLWIILTGEDGSGANEYSDVWRIGCGIYSKLPAYSNRSLNNIISNPSLSAGSNGVATGFTSVSNAGIKANYSIENAQRIDITNSTALNSAVIKQFINSINPSLKYVFSIIFKTSGDVYMNIYLDWFDEAFSYLDTTILSISGESSTEYDLYTSGIITPTANAINCQLSFGIVPNAIGSIGTGWFKEAVLSP